MAQPDAPDPPAEAVEASPDDYATPKWLMAILFPDARYFDPCPLGGKASGVNGLTIDWPTDRPVYINPPFSNPLPWCRRAASHPGPVVMLLPTDPTTRWWTYSDGFEVILIGSRLHFNEMATYARQKLCLWRRGNLADALPARRAEAPDA
jgi:hypothetical protein